MATPVALAVMPMQRALRVQAVGGWKIATQVALFYHSEDDVVL